MEVHVHGLRVSDVEVAVRLRREPGPDLFLEVAGHREWEGGLVIERHGRPNCERHKRRERGRKALGESI